MNGIEKTCFLIWKMIQLTLIFHLLSLAGLIVFGVGPAWQTIVTLFLKTSQEENHYSLKSAVQLWKSYFKEANLRFGLFALTFLFLTFNLHWAVQFPSLFWFTVSFLIVIAMVWLTMTYLYMVFYAVSYEISLYQRLFKFQILFTHAERFAGNYLSDLAIQRSLSLFNLRSSSLLLGLCH